MAPFSFCAEFSTSSLPTVTVLLKGHFKLLSLLLSHILPFSLLPVYHLPVSFDRFYPDTALYATATAYTTVNDTLFTIHLVWLSRMICLCFKFKAASAVHVLQIIHLLEHAVMQCSSSFFLSNYYNY